MLDEIRIKNFTIIKDLVISFKEGLNILTGETGAGKSIIVDALSMFVTPRASVDLISSDSKEAQVEAVFYNISEELINRLNNELSIDAGQGLILRRIISSQGRARAFINDTSVSMQTLVSVGSKLITIHGQHESQGLLKKESHLILLDNYAGLKEECKDLKILYERSKELKTQLQDLIQTMRERTQREEFLNYQIKEIDEANLKIGELQDLKEEQSLLANINRLKELSEEAYYQLYGVDGSVLERLKHAYSSILSVADLDKSVAEIADLLHSAIAIVDDAVSLIRSKKDTYEANPHRLNEINDRLDLIKRLLKKYGDTVEDVLNYRESIQGQLSSLSLSSDRQRQIQEELSFIEKELKEKAIAISTKRLEASHRLQRAINEELINLGFKSASIVINMESKDEVTSTGIDDVEFLFTANPTEPPRPLNKVASGGELSRIMLAIRSVSLWSSQDSVGETVIFDEVDSGIGGNTALQVGRRLKEIADNYQTLCITHLPQIAALAHNHLMINKVTSDDSTEVTVKELNREERKYEIARMLSGTATDTALRHAEELLAGHL